MFLLNFRFANNANAGIIYNVANPKEHSEVIKFCNRYFLSTEPMCAALVFEPDESIPEFEEYCQTALDTGLSVIARDAKTNEIVGCRLSGIADKADYKGFDIEVNHPLIFHL